MRFDNPTNSLPSLEASPLGILLQDPKRRHRTAMAESTTVQKPPPTAKTLVFDLPTQTLHVEPSHPIPTPNPAKNDHLIHVKATALCARELDWPTLYPATLFAENPDKQITPGYDLAGTVMTSPPGSSFHVGDEIYARTRPSRPGNCREYTIARTEEMALKPQKLDWVDAATVPLSALTAWQALFEHGGVKGLDDSSAKGEKVLVTAAAGGVGVWLVQLARIAGLHVVAQVGSPEHDKFARELGASETINYKTTSLKEWARKEGLVDIVFDLLGGDILEEAWFCVKDGGALVSMFEPPDLRKPAALEKKDVRSLFFIMEPNGEQLGEISKLIGEGICRPVLDSGWELEDYEKAFERLNGGHANGKVVIKVTG
jgi:NADPH:quinone reductase-like Zn-dependent oxidoreductase